MLLPEEKFPDSKTIAINNLLGMGGALLLCFLLATMLHLSSASLLEAGLVCCGLFLVTTLLISRFAKAASNNSTYQLWLPRACYVALGLLVVGGIGQAIINAIPSPTAPVSAFQPRPQSCLDHISHGKWVAARCTDASAVPGQEPKAFCETDSWVWEPLLPGEATSASECPVGKVSNNVAKAAFKNKRIVFAGDSMLRNTYHAFNLLLDPAYKFNSSVSFRHGNLAQQQKSINATVSFYWAPMVHNISTVLDMMAQGPKYDLLVCGAAAWDALYIKSLEDYKAELLSMAQKLKSSGQSQAVSVWLQPTTIVDNRLTTLEKQKDMSEKVIAAYRQSFTTSPARSAFGVVLDPTGASKSREGATVDGIHYSEDIYKVIAQMCGNAFALHFPQLYVRNPTRKVGKAKATGSMSFPSYGIIVLICAAVMLYTMDSFFGFGWAMQRLLGVTDQQAADMLWENAYREVHKKNGIAHPSSSSRSSSERGDSDREDGRETESDQSALK